MSKGTFAVFAAQSFIGHFERQARTEPTSPSTRDKRRGHLLEKLEMITPLVAGFSKGTRDRLHASVNNLLKALYKGDAIVLKRSKFWEMPQAKAFFTALCQPAPIEDGHFIESPAVVALDSRRPAGTRVLVDRHDESARAAVRGSGR